MNKLMIIILIVSSLLTAKNSVDPTTDLLQRGVEERDSRLDKFVSSYLRDDSGYKENMMEFVISEQKIVNKLICYNIRQETADRYRNQLYITEMHKFRNEPRSTEAKLVNMFVKDKMGYNLSDQKKYFKGLRTKVILKK